MDAIQKLVQHSQESMSQQMSELEREVQALAQERQKALQGLREKQQEMLNKLGRQMQRDVNEFSTSAKKYKSTLMHELSTTKAATSRQIALVSTLNILAPVCILMLILGLTWMGASKWIEHQTSTILELKQNISSLKAAGGQVQLRRDENNKLWLVVSKDALKRKLPGSSDQVLVEVK